MKHDKKRNDNGFTVVFVPEVGRFELRNVSGKELGALIKEALA